LWFDVDRDNIETATRDARRLAAFLVERFALDGDYLLLFVSGAKGFHVRLPTSLWLPEPSLTFNRIARRMAETLAAAVGVIIDDGVYDKVRFFRASNSRHPKTGRHKRRLSFDELLGLSVEAVLKLAECPTPFDVPPTPARNLQAVADWQAAADEFDAGLIVLDYIQRVAPPGDHGDKRGSVDATMNHLRQFADAAVAVVVVSAVGRTKDSKGRSSYAGDGLNLASFRESSELEFGADDGFILAPHAKADDVVILRHLKSRNSETLDIELTFDKRLQRFTPSGPLDTFEEKATGKLQAALGALWDHTDAADDADDVEGWIDAEPQRTHSADAVGLLSVAADGTATSTADPAGCHQRTQGEGIGEGDGRAVQGVEHVHRLHAANAATKRNRRLVGAVPRHSGRHRSDVAD
jgi:hypothetical protein